MKVGSVRDCAQILYAYVLKGAAMTECVIALIAEVINNSRPRKRARSTSSRARTAGTPRNTCRREGDGMAGGWGGVEKRRLHEARLTSTAGLSLEIMDDLGVIWLRHSPAHAIPGMGNSLKT